LAAVVGVVDQLGEGVIPSGPGGHLERVEDVLRGGRPHHPPADDAPGEGVGHEGGVAEAATATDVGEVGHPQPVGCGRQEVALDEVGQGHVPLGRGRRAHARAADHARESGDTHEPSHLVTADLDAFAS